MHAHPNQLPAARMRIARHGAAAEQGPATSRSAKRVLPVTPKIRITMELGACQVPRGCGRKMLMPASQGVALYLSRPGGTTGNLWPAQLRTWEYAIAASYCCGRACARDACSHADSKIRSFQKSLFLTSFSWTVRAFLEELLIFLDLWCPANRAVLEAKHELSN